MSLLQYCSKKKIKSKNKVYFLSSYKNNGKEINALHPFSDFLHLIIKAMMNKLSVLAYCILILILLNSCNAQQDRSEMSESDSYGGVSNAIEYADDIEVEVPRTAEPPTPITHQNKSVHDPKIIRDGNVEFEVTDLESAKQRLDLLVKKFKGYYETESFEVQGVRQNYFLIARIPQVSFDSLLVNMNEGIGKLVSKSLQMDDVTESYYDTKLRMDSELAYLEQYRAILKKAVTIKDIVDIQEKIRLIEVEIESKKGRLQYMDSKVFYSTLVITLFEIRKNVATSPNFFRSIFNAFQDGIAFSGNLLIGIISLWPLWILILLTLYLIRKYWRNKKD